MTESDVVFARSEQADTCILVATGEIDLASANRFAQELHTLLERGSGTGLVDLSGVTFIDSSGVRELLAAKRESDQLGGLLLLKPSAACRRVLEISGVWNQFVVQEA